MQPAALSGDSLEDNFQLEDQIHGDSLEDNCLQDGENLQKETPEGSNTKKAKKAKKPKKEAPKITYESLGFQFAELEYKTNSNSYSQLLHKIYLTKPKPLVIKSHSKVKVIIVCANALRVLQVVAELKSKSADIRVIKLFARHLKIADQVAALAGQCFHVAVGLNKILKDSPEAIPVQKLECVILDSSYVDLKMQGMVEIIDLRRELLLLKGICGGTNVEFYKF